MPIKSQKKPLLRKETITSTTLANCAKGNHGNMIRMEEIIKRTKNAIRMSLLRNQRKEK